MYRYFFVFLMLWAMDTQAGVPAPHDVRITEIMANSAFRIDWVEITNTARKTVDMKGCKLRVGLGRIKEKTFSKLPMAPGRRVIIATSAFPLECKRTVDMVWSGVSMPASRPEAVELWCPTGRRGEVVDRVLFNIHTAKVAAGHSINYCENNVQQPGLMKGWAATRDQAFCSILGASDFGSPGLPGSCPALKKEPNIQIGDIEITEIMVKPISGTPEWVELTNVTQKSENLDGCTLHIGLDSQWNDIPLDNIKIQAVGTTVLASHCGITSPNPGKEIVVKGLRLVDSKPRKIQLLCGRTVISQAGYDPTLGDVQAGHSICFDYETDPARPSDKCAASNLSPYFSAPNGVNYGTPFDPAPCNKNSVLQSEETRSSGCSMGFGVNSDNSIWLMLLLFSVLFLLRRKPKIYP